MSGVPYEDGADAAHPLSAIDAIVERVRPLLEAEGLSCEDEHTLLTAEQNIREFVLSGGEYSVAVRIYGARVVNTSIAPALLKCAFGWIAAAADPIPLLWGVGLWPGAPHPDWGRIADDPRAPDVLPRMLRAELESRLLNTPHMLPDPVLRAPIKALRALDDGSGRVPSLFRPAPKEGRGLDPERARALEEGMWIWIHEEVGRGKRETKRSATWPRRRAM